MKMRGFTLAEVLITLAIIGVVAALTMPSLVSNVQKQKVGPALAKAINTLENANKMILKDNDARSLGDVCGEQYLKCIEPYVNGVFDSSTTGTISDASGYSEPVGGGVFIPAAYGRPRPYRPLSITDSLNTKDGISYIATGGLGFMDGGSSSNAPAKYHGSYYEINIDINGAEVDPNEQSIDRFTVLVDYYGSVIPYGGREYKEYIGGGSILWEDGCENTAGTPSIPQSCAGSIVDNGYKVIYDY